METKKEILLTGLRWCNNILTELAGDSGFLTKEQRELFLTTISDLSDFERSLRFPEAQALDELIRESEALGMYEPQEEV